MDIAWCTKCKTSVSLKHAADELPCPSCSATSYMIICCGSHSINECDSLAEHFMVNGKWEDAVAEYQDCQSFEPSELNLRMATLEWRKDCAQYVHNLVLSCGKLSVADLRQKLLENYDEFVAKWILQEYRQIVFVPDKATYSVQWREEA